MDMVKSNRIEHIINHPESVCGGEGGGGGG